MQKECLNCNRTILNKLNQIISIANQDNKYLNNYVHDYLSGIDLSLKNPYVMGNLYGYIYDYLKVKDPYADIKKNYNQYVLSMSTDIYNYINQSANPLLTSLQCAIKGNLIDFGANHTFSKDLLKKLIFDDIELAIDDSNELFNKLNISNSLLYLCDNCGEIILDLIFIDYIHKFYPDLNIYMHVRSHPIINDICKDDIELLDIPDYIHVTDSGFRSPGVLYEYSTDEFKQLFDSADVIISKGQGNFEGLNDISKEHLYFLFMSKCEIISNIINAENMSVVCKKQNI